MKKFIKIYYLELTMFLLAVVFISIGAFAYKSSIQEDKDRLQKVNQYFANKGYSTQNIESLGFDRPEFGTGCIDKHRVFLVETIKNNIQTEIKMCCDDDCDSCHISKEVIVSK